MTAHELAELFPAMPDEQLKELSTDIKKHGLRDPIVTLGGKILDGRQREAACLLVGVSPTYVPFEILNGVGNGGPLAYVMSENFYRRDLNESQRAVIAAEAKLKEMELVKPVVKVPKGTKTLSKRGRIGEGRPPTGDVTAGVAKLGKVSRMTAARAVKVLREAPEKIPAIKAGKLTVCKAVKQIRAKKTKPKKDKSCGLTRNSSLRSLFGKVDANGGAIYAEIGDYAVRAYRLTCGGER